MLHERNGRFEIDHDDEPHCYPLRLARGWELRCRDFGASLLNALNYPSHLAFGPRFCGLSVRPVCCSSLSIHASLPSGLPDVSDIRKAFQLVSSSCPAPRKSAKRPYRSITGATRTSASSLPARFALALDQRRSCARSTSRARTGLSDT